MHQIMLFILGYTDVYLYKASSKQIKNEYYMDNIIFQCVKFPAYIFSFFMYINFYNVLLQKFVIVYYNRHCSSVQNGKKAIK